MREREEARGRPVIDSCSSGTKSTMNALNEKLRPPFLRISSTSRRAHVESVVLLEVRELTGASAASLGGATALMEAGVDKAVIPCNTIHQFLPYVEKELEKHATEYPQLKLKANKMRFFMMALRDVAFILNNKSDYSMHRFFST